MLYRQFIKGCAADIACSCEGMRESSSKIMGDTARCRTLVRAKNYVQCQLPAEKEIANNVDFCRRVGLLVVVAKEPRKLAVALDP
jgi:hypothetical protein